MILTLKLPLSSYDIVIEKGCLNDVGNLLNLNRKVLVITDDGVPEEYSKKVLDSCKEGYLKVVKQGEESKSLEVYAECLKVLLDNSFTRKDAVVAVGGGVVGDLAGFVAASYMRGIDFYNIPTTSLSQIDSSIGGKTAVNFGGIKNIVGAFYQPKKVLVDVDTLKTLNKKQYNSGLVEACKMALTSNGELFEIFENEDIDSNLERIIVESLKIKKAVVEEDEKESGLRKILNFGHTIGHGIEANAEGLYHGECVGIGMLPMCSEDVRERLLKVLNKLDIPTCVSLNTKDVMDALKHDKKTNSGCVTAVLVEKPGTFVLKDMSFEEIENKLGVVIKEAE